MTWHIINLASFIVYPTVFFYENKLFRTVIVPKKARYGVDTYQFATTKPAQTTMRSVIGKLDCRVHRRGRKAGPGKE